MKEYESFIIVKCRARSELEASLRVNRMLELSKKEEDISINHLSTAPTYYWINHNI
ncbi:MAG: hypothetical protein ISS46_02290 [Candidatus Omnitrophica bacterium]|nr:hypothetical protein [Candidatus Omnitrophota bacterium]